MMVHPTSTALSVPTPKRQDTMRKTPELISDDDFEDQTCLEPRNVENERRKCVTQAVIEHSEQEGINKISPAKSLKKRTRRRKPNSKNIDDGELSAPRIAFLDLPLDVFLEVSLLLSAYSDLDVG